MELDSFALAVDTDGSWYVAYYGPNPSATRPWAQFISSTGAHGPIAEVPYDCMYPDIDVDSQGRLHAVFYGLNFPEDYPYDSAIMYTNTGPTVSAVPAPGAAFLGTIGLAYSACKLRRRRTL